MIRGDGTVKEVADFLSIHTETVRQLSREGKFPNAYKCGAGKVNSPIRIPWSDVEAYRAKQPRVNQ